MSEVQPTGQRGRTAEMATDPSLAPYTTIFITALWQPVQQGITPRAAARRYHPADGSSTVAKIAADLRPSVDGSTVRTSLMAGGS